MDKKRCNEDSAESSTLAKRVKHPEFNGTAFKAMLKDPSTAMKGRVVRSLSHSLSHQFVDCFTFQLRVLNSFSFG